MLSSEDRNGWPCGADPCGGSRVEARIGRGRMRFEIGELTFDGDTRLLLRGATPVPLSTRAFDLLELLLRERPRVFSHAELKDRLWPGTFVSYTALPRLVSELRRALGDDPRSSRFVRSVHRFGYAFSGPVRDLTSRPPDDATEYELIWGEHSVALLPGENLVGRSPACRLRIVSGKVSRHHARLEVGPGGVRLEDLGSRNGTWWRGERLAGPVELNDGDEIGIGDELLIFRAGDLLPTESDDGRGGGRNDGRG